MRLQEYEVIRLNSTRWAAVFSVSAKQLDLQELTLQPHTRWLQCM